MDKKNTILVVVFSLFSSLLISQNSWYVSENGNNSTGDGSISAPWATITKAMGENVVVDNDTINIIGTITQDGDAEYGIQVLKDLIFKGVTKETSIIEASDAMTSADRRVLTIWDVAQVKLINLTIRNGYFDAYSYQPGAGILNWGQLSIENCVISDNYTDNEYRGGGIYNQFGTLSIENTYINNNYSYNGGGGLAIEGGAVSIVNSSFALNFTQNDLAGGGAIYIENTSNVSIINSTIYYNMLGLNSYGAGIYATATEGDINIEIINTTIANNEAGAGSYGTGIFLNNETSYNVNMTLKNTIIANGNTDNYGHNGSGAINILRSYTLCKDASLPDGSINSNSNNTDPLIDTFMDHGGLTPTCSISSNSPARDAGTIDNAPTTDQRGYPRCGSVDIGSFEYQSSTDITSITENNNIAVYPNPTSNFINIAINSSSKRVASLYLINSIGNKVKDINTTSNINKLKINVSDMPNGLYYLKVDFEDNSSETLKIIINN